MRFFFFGNCFAFYDDDPHNYPYITKLLSHFVIRGKKSIIQMAIPIMSNTIIIFDGWSYRFK
jgi:hypothetical protein